MTEKRKSEAGGPASLSEAVQRAEAALASLKHALDEGEVGELGDKVKATASALMHEGEQLIGRSETLSHAREDLSGAIRRNPLAAVGVAFGAGLLLALLVKS
jgi:ElaB/YqjD/DUF883 family membrane-anchored ribosome-binding protein